MSSTLLTSSTLGLEMSSKNGSKSNNSLSWVSLNQLDIGIECSGWKIYDAGELSMMIHSLRGRPI